MFSTEALNLARLPVAISGEWRLESKRWFWDGVARAAEPLVGLVFCDQSGLVQWARSDHRASEAGLPIRLQCSVHRSRRWIYCGIGGLSGRGFVQGNTAASDLDLPIINAGDAPVTGQVLPFTALQGEPAVSIHLFLLVRRDVRSRRLGLWGIRPALLGGIEEPWRKIVQYGRSGRFAIWASG